MIGGLASAAHRMQRMEDLGWRLMDGSLSQKQKEAIRTELDELIRETRK